MSEVMQWVVVAFAGLVFVGRLAYNLTNKPSKPPVEASSDEGQAADSGGRTG